MSASARVIGSLLLMVDHVPLSCSGVQTVALEPANKGRFRLTFGANKDRLGPTITANEPTFRANSLPTAC
jgi:hypothetical protein